MDGYQYAIEELALDGAVSLGRCSPSTVYRWAREINQRLEQEHYSWRVKAVPRDCSLIRVTEEPI